MEIKAENLIEWYKYMVDYFQTNKIPVFIHGSTLLGFVRNGVLLDRITFDKELNFGIRSTDLTLDMLYKMKRDLPYFYPTGEHLENSLIYFGPEPIIRYHSKNQTMWDMKPGCGLLAVFWKGKTKWIEYMGGDLCLTWPRSQLDQFSCKDMYQRRVNTPHDYHAWLSHYFGINYEEEKKDWHWSSNSHNLESFKTLKEEGEI